MLLVRGDGRARRRHRRRAPDRRSYRRHLTGAQQGDRSSITDTASSGASEVNTRWCTGSIATSSGMSPIGTRGPVRSQPRWFRALQWRPLITDADASPKFAVKMAWLRGSIAIAHTPRPAGVVGHRRAQRLVSAALQCRRSTMDRLPGASLNAWLAV